jgi:hypothetical protein
MKRNPIRVENAWLELLGKIFKAEIQEKGEKEELTEDAVKVYFREY